MNEIAKNKSKIVHEPVLLNEILGIYGQLAPLKDQGGEKLKPIVIDATLGGGGHAIGFIKRGAYVLGIDADEMMVKIAGGNLRKEIDSYFACPTGNYDTFFKIVNANFASIDQIAEKEGIDKADFILFDLGISSYHLIFKNRGFSFRDTASLLDMRLTNTLNVTAADLLNALPKKALRDLFIETMPYRDALLLANKVVLERNKKRIETVRDFSEIINKSLNKKKRSAKSKISVETLPFLALRIAVNSELENLKITLNKSWKILRKGGIMAVISFHSGEDRVVKIFGGNLIKAEKAEEVGGLIKPTEKEIETNIRARSAKMRTFKKLV